MEEKDGSSNMNTKNGNFICGVVEGFYGRPWTPEQRKELFHKLKKWGMNSYVYAPKDDSKHRANWRDLYTVEEAEHLTSLISAANENGITFYYALSPGLDITYSNTKEVVTLKRKLEQVSQLGCSAFALLFDDIDPEMSEADKEVFQSFAHAQVSLTNDVYQHLNQPKFLVCPTQYCAARAVPNVQSSEYLSTIGSKLAPSIDIMWTGGKVISRVLTIESIEEVSEVLRRPPVIWDNLHANDYDQKRVFLGPYQGRSPDLIPKLRGVLTNPNCEFWANFVAIHTLAQWSRCSADGDRERNESVSSDIKLETETDDGAEVPASLPINMYHARRALRNAIVDWLPEFYKNKAASGFISKPQVLSSLVQVPAVLAAPVPPTVVNTCIALTTTTATTTPQLATLAEICTTVNGNSGPVVMNSLLSETKVCTEPMDCNPTPSDDTSKSTPTEERVSGADPKGEDDSAIGTSNMVVDSTSPEPEPETSESPTTDMSDWSGEQVNIEDLTLLCDLFYLPFEHGSQGVQLLQEFYWLHTNANLVTEPHTKSEVEEWYRRAGKLEEMSRSINRLFLKLNNINNKELMYELYPYVWEMRAVISTLNSYIKWLGGGKVGQLAENSTTGNYTWFSKGWKESFMSGDQEPWVFRGGLAADLQRLIPVDGGSDLFLYRIPQVATSTMYTIRQLEPGDRDQVIAVTRDSSSCLDAASSQQKMVELLLKLGPEMSFVVEEEKGEEGDKRVVGYAGALVKPLPPATDQSQEDQLLHQVLSKGGGSQYPSVMCCALSHGLSDQSLAKRLVVCLLAALRASGSSGVYTAVGLLHSTLIEFYSKLGFVELSRDETLHTVYLGRVF